MLHAPDCEEAPEGAPLLDVRRALVVAESPGARLCAVCGCAQSCFRTRGTGQVCLTARSVGRLIVQSRLYPFAAAARARFGNRPGTDDRPVDHPPRPARRASY
ncbi:DUF6233 domain-containing protein [Streptomyces sp. NPDC057682]|uniref:DUF6233 domain-containing protein n=1 Tax=Streptomyces sp. NPDC057682 TaxID=3346210 RepID=UPI0036BE5DF3